MALEVSVRCFQITCYFSFFGNEHESVFALNRLNC